MWLGKGKGVTYSEALFHFLTFQPRRNILNIATIYVRCIGLMKVNVTSYQEMEVCHSSNCIIRMHMGLYRVAMAASCTKHSLLLLQQLQDTPYSTYSAIKQ